jgi:hypothetical protein
MWEANSSSQWYLPRAVPNLRLRATQSPSTSPVVVVVVVVVVGLLWCPPEVFNRHRM